MSDERKNGEPNARQTANRLIGLSCYAGAVIMFGLLGMAIYEELKAGRSLTDDPTTIVIFACAALVFLGLGYSSGQRKKASASRPEQP